VVARHATIEGDQVVVGRPADRQIPLDGDLARLAVRVGHAQDRARRPRARDGVDPRLRRVDVVDGRLVFGIQGDRAMATASGDRFGETRVDADVGPFDGRIGQEVDPRAIDDGVAVRARERQRAVGQLGGEGRGHVTELGQVGRVEVDDEAVRHERAIGGRQSLRLHRAFDAPLQLDGLETCPEEAGGRTFEEAFEEPLDGGERRHGPSQTSRGSGTAPAADTGPSARGSEYPRPRGARDRCCS